MQKPIQEVKDQMGRTISLPGSPKRVVSLVPSMTELLFDLGLEKSIVGVTKFCVHPVSARKEKSIVGGTKKFHFDRIAALKPDLIIGNKEENTKAGIEELEQHFPVWMSDINSYDAALEMISGLGELLDVKEKTTALLKEIRSEFDSIQSMQGQKVLYFIWKNPYMVAGSNTFIDSVLKRVGLENMAETERYPELKFREIEAIAPEVILLSSEPFPFKSAHVEEFKKALPNTQVMLVDGEYFSWYGSRLAKAPAYFNSLNFC